MEKTNKNIERDSQIMKSINVSEMRHMLAHTNVGDLTLLLRKGEVEYTFCLDAVPVSKDQNKELMDLYFPKPLMVPQVNKNPIKQSLQDMGEYLSNSMEKSKQEDVAHDAKNAFSAKTKVKSGSKPPVNSKKE